MVIGAASVLNINAKNDLTANAACNHNYQVVKYQAHTYKSWTETYWAGGRIVTAYKSKVHVDTVYKCSKCGHYDISCP